MKKVKELIRKYDEKCIRISVPFVMMYLDALDRLRFKAENHMDRMKLEEKTKVNQWIRRK